MSDLQNIHRYSTMGTMTKWFVRGAGILAAAMLATCGIASMAFAQTLQSPHFRFDESTISSGGLVQSNSPNFIFGSSIGDTGIGNSLSSNFQVEAGSQTTNDPALSFIINGGAVSFGSFSATTPTLTTSTFSVLNYTSYGYVVQIIGSSLNNNGYTLPAMASTGPSVAGTEQFGINLVANTAPSSIGANPDHGNFGFGDAAPNYATPNSYRYVSGETIATAPKSSGVTTYTITYLVNVKSLTPGGIYQSAQTLICTGTY